MTQAFGVGGLLNPLEAEGTYRATANPSAPRHVVALAGGATTCRRREPTRRRRQLFSTCTIPARTAPQLLLTPSKRQPAGIPVLPTSADPC